MDKQRRDVKLGDQNKISQDDWDDCADQRCHFNRCWLTDLTGLPIAQLTGLLPRKRRFGLEKMLNILAFRCRGSLPTHGTERGSFIML